MITYTCTYSPDDNKIRLSASSRLDAETYARVKEAGFSWAPKQEQFIAPMWTPGRADLCIELAGEIEDDDGSLIERAEERAERFEDYSDKRGAESQRASEYVRSIADGIPFGQPILVGHHSEAHARRDAKRIENGMRRAVDLFDTAEYWKRRAASAIAHAKYKERADVRHRRIKGIEADARKVRKNIENAQQNARVWEKVPRYEWDKQTAIALFIAGRCSGSFGGSLYSDLSAGRIHGDTAWRRAVASAEAYIHGDAARWLDHYENRLSYERAMLGESGGIAADRFDIQVGGRVLVGSEWCVVLRVNKSGGSVVSVTTTARYVAVRGIEEVQDYRAPDPEDAEKVAAVSKLAPMCNYPGEGFHSMTKTEWDGVYKDYKGSRDLGVGAKPNRYGRELDATQTAAVASGLAPHRLRSMVRHGSMVYVYLTDAKRTDPPKVGDAPKGRARGPWNSEPKAPAAPVTFERQIEPSAPVPTPVPGKPETLAGETKSDIDAMRASLRTGVQVVSAPQLFPTPVDLAARMVELAGIEPGDYVLEPSAGTGRIVDAIRADGRAMHITAVEINHALADGVRSRVERLAVGDFLACSIATLGSHFHSILMNPPFANGADVDHVTHAVQFLAPGGRLVAIMSAGVNFREDRKTREFRELVERMDGYIEDLPDGTFESSGTGVRTVLVVLEAPTGGRATREADAPAESITEAPTMPDAAPDAGMVAEIVRNQMRRRVEWASELGPLPIDIEREARGLDEIAAQMEPGDQTRANYRAAAVRLREIAGSPQLIAAAVADVTASALPLATHSQALPLTTQSEEN